MTPTPVGGSALQFRVASRPSPTGFLCHDITLGEADAKPTREQEGDNCDESYGLDGYLRGGHLLGLIDQLVSQSANHCTFHPNLFTNLKQH